MLPPGKIALNELAQSRKLAMHVDESQIKVTETVRAACELLGLDSLYVANKGRFVAFLPAKQVDQALEILPGASCAGRVLDETSTTVYLRSMAGGERILHMISGEQLPRIC